MWQIFAFGSLFSYAGEEVVDKFALSSQPKIHYAVASFIRLFFYCVFVLVVGAWGVLGNLSVFLHPLVLLVAALSVPSTIFYTYIFKRVEVTGIGMVAYLGPFIFLFVDINFLHTAFTAVELAGIGALVLGGMAFAIDTQTMRLRKEFSPIVLGIFAFEIGYSGLEAYSFKYLHAAYGISGPTFLANVWVLACIGIAALIFLQGRQALLVAPAARTYARRVFFSKGFDALGSVLWAQALTLAAVSQVSAVEGLAPLVLFALVWFVQEVLHIPLKETLGKRGVLWKSGAVSLLVLGGLLVG